MIVSIIVAMAENRVIGRNNRIPWDLPADRQRFRELTMGHSLIMGRKTFESIGRPLPGRRMIVLSRREAYRPPDCLVLPELPAALAACRGEDEVFICGGAEVYAEALPLADRIYLTLLHDSVSGDTFFPPFDEADFAVARREPLPGELPATFMEYRRERR